MGEFVVDGKSQPGLVRMVLKGVFDAGGMAAFVAAHNHAVDEQGTRDYKVWVDLRELAPLSPEATELMEGAKRYSNQRQNFRGSAVLVKKGTVALQHRRTSTSSGLADTELISDDEEALRRHLREVFRK